MSNLQFCDIMACDFIFKSSMKISLPSYKKLYPYLGAFAALAAVAIISHYIPALFHFFESNSEHELLLIFFEVGSLFVLSFIIFYISHITALPSFVMAIFFGIAAHPFLEPIIESHALLGSLVGLSATLILFGGGLETPFLNFRKLFWRIFALSFPGLLLTAYLFSVTTNTLGGMMEHSVSLIVAVLLGAVLASTDPAAIIPVLRKLRFYNRDTKDIIVSESAVTDVTGTLVTVALLGLITAGVSYSSVTDWYGTIFSAASGAILLRQIAFGVFFGLVGYLFLEILQRFKRNHEREFEADSAFFLFVPVIIFAIAVSFGGSGYLAAFIAGLLLNLTEHLHETERFFNHIIDGFLKPMVFLLLGALIHPEELITYAGLGIMAALIFMFVIRPLTVFLMLSPFTVFGKNRLNWRELAFISFVRETGAIPAVLIVTIASLKIPNTEGLVAVGMWVILLTLIIEPIFTPFVARKLKVAEEINDAAKPDTGTGPVVVLGTRGHSFVKRLPHVLDWTTKHNAKRIMVLLCPEDKYSDAFVADTKRQAETLFNGLSESRKKENKPTVEFSFLACTGFLQDNISRIADSDNNVTAIFVGRKMLDFRLNEIKQLKAPIFFMD